MDTFFIFSDLTIVETLGVNTFRLVTGNVLWSPLIILKLGDCLRF
jgi:hypothetical protein